MTLPKYFMTTKIRTPEQEYFHQWYLKHRVLKTFPIPERIKKRFLECHTPTNEDECWEWTGAKHYQRGYGMIGHYNGKKSINQYAHRYSYEHYIGPIPDGLHVLHTCDNPSCVNPHHLFLGTNADNVKDKVDKDRQSKGESNHHKYSEEFIHMLKYSDEPAYLLAEKVGVRADYINAIRRGIYWKHI